MAELTPRDREMIAELETFQNRVHRVRAVVERFASEPGHAETLSAGVRRAFNQLKLQFTSAGFDTMAQICGSMESVARFGSSHRVRSTKLREAVGTLSRLLDQERRSIVTAAKSRSQTTH